MNFETRDRMNEWFVPSFGPKKFRALVGMLFLPYTGMVLGYTVIGSMLAPEIYWDRVAAIVVIYFLALGIGAHALDALGAKGVKPWGSVFPPRQLKALAAGSILLAYAIGIYYMVLYAPLLWVIAIMEGFFLFAYNLEWFSARFHTDSWFAVSWGALPVLAGYVLQTNQISTASLLIAAATGLFSLVEIKASRAYKELRRANDPASHAQIQRYEIMLKSLSLGLILLAAGLLCWQLAND